MASLPAVGGDGGIEAAVAEGIVALINGERPASLMNPEIFGDETLYPEIYGRGPAVPVTEGGPAIYAY